MNDYQPPPKIVKLLIFIMIGAVLVVFTDVFVIDGGRAVISHGVPKVMSFFDRDEGLRASGDASVNVATLREQHEHYMEGGIDDYARIDTTTIFPAPIMVERLARVKNMEHGDEDLARIEPAAGAEGVVNVADLDIMGSPKGSLDDLDDLYTAIYREQEGGANIAPRKREDKEPVDFVLANLSAEANVELGARVEKLRDVIPVPRGVKPKYIPPRGHGNVVIIIDDMGLSLRGKQIEVLPGPLTLSYLPYAKNLSQRTARARAQGHELMVHMPMEAMNGSLDGGPRVLRVAQSPQQLVETMQWGLSQFEGYVGVNNHMGSRLTSDAEAMRVVMGYLKSKNVFFIDSRTISSSVAAKTAREYGLAYAERDVFLDHEINMDFIRGALKKLEGIARQKGYAIAIGHPHKETIAALKEWLPTLQAKGLTLVPASAVLNHPIPANDNVVSNSLTSQ